MKGDGKEKSGASHRTKGHLGKNTLRAKVKMEALKTTSGSMRTIGSS